MNRRDRRERLPSRKHALAVLATTDGGLKIRCNCGALLGTRYEDRMMVTLSDLLAMVRLHWEE